MKRPIVEKLLAFGFTKDNENYIYRKEIVNGQFALTVTVAADGAIHTKVIDTAFGEEYVLHLVSGSVGGFIGQVREEYDAVLREIEQNCCEPDVFKEKMTKKLIAYVRDTYGDELEYLWETFPDNAVWRRKDNRKWYGAILTVRGNKLGLATDETVEIADLRLLPEQMEALVDGKRYFPGWHMNKKHWYSVLLDGSVPYEEICHRIDESYRIAKKG